jgi:uncharacterized protein (DUF302 family)
MEDGIVTKDSPGSVDGVVARLTALIAAKGVTLFAVVDHSGEAKGHGLDLRDTKLVIFGSPVAGTPAMQQQPLTALDLPLKVLIWDDGGQTRVSYTNPTTLAARHHLTEEVAAPLAAIGPLTDALTAPGENAG